MTELITLKEAASILRCAPSSISRYIKSGSLCPEESINGRHFFNKEKVLNFKRPVTPKDRLNYNQRTSTGLNKSEFMDILEKWQVNSRDTGSADVEIGVYTEKIKRLEIQMKGIATSDAAFKNMRYKLLRYLGERRRLLRYLETSDYGRYRKALALLEKEA